MSWIVYQLAYRHCRRVDDIRCGSFPLLAIRLYACFFHGFLFISGSYQLNVVPEVLGALPFAS